MRVCVLVSSYEHSTSELRDVDPYPDPSPYLIGHDVERCFVHKATAARQIEELAARGFDVFINLCDGTSTEDIAGIEVTQALEDLGLAFTGARSSCWDPTREEMKRACEKASIDTPKYSITNDARDAGRIAEQLRFPMIVKHPHGYSSIALSRASRVESLPALSQQLSAMIEAHGSALVEEFIEGREFTVLVTEPGDDNSKPHAYAPIEIRFPKGETFKHFDLKWVEHAGMEWIPVADEALAARLMDVSRRFFTALGGSGYGRCDFRVDERGIPYVLEMNPNCGIYYERETFGSADMIIDKTPGGHVAFTEHIIKCALRCETFPLSTERSGAGEGARG